MADAPAAAGRQPRPWICDACEDTGENPAERAYWAAWAAIEAGAWGHHLPARPDRGECEECPSCSECGRRVAEHSDAELERAGPEAGATSVHVWCLPLCGAQVPPPGADTSGRR